jgi:hypothetical protein
MAVGVLDNSYHHTPSTLSEKVFLDTDPVDGGGRIREKKKTGGGRLPPVMNWIG